MKEGFPSRSYHKEEDPEREQPQVAELEHATEVLEARLALMREEPTLGRTPVLEEAANSGEWNAAPDLGQTIQELTGE